MPNHSFMIKSGVNYSISLNRAQVVHLHRIPHLNGRLFYGFVLLTKESLLKARPSVLFLVNVMFKLMLDSRAFFLSTSTFFLLLKSS